MLLLCELLGPDPFRHYRNEVFPFILGMCRKAGIDAAWLTIGVSVKSGETERFFIDLEPGDREALKEAVTSRGATGIVFNESIETDLADFLRDAFPSLTIKCLGDLDVTAQGSLKAGTVRRLAGFLGLNLDEGVVDMDSALLDEIEPVYAREPLEESRLPELVFLRVLLGKECAHSKPLAKNPFYGSIDLDAATHDRGCAFCMAGDKKSDWLPGTDALELAFRQIERAATDVIDDAARQALHTLDDGRLKFIIQGAAAFRRLDSFLHGICKRDLPPSAFLFSCRADELLARSETLESRLPELEKRGHAIHIWVMGIENFSQEENMRLNKHIDARQILEVTHLMDRLEQKHPDGFNFTRYGGFSFILFTPWTRIDDLRTNIAWARKIGISRDSFFLRSRIQLLRGRPISLLAQHDDLVVERFSEPYFDSGCIQSHHDQELSWRFLHAPVAIIYRLGSRLHPESTDLEDDSLYLHVQHAVSPFYLCGMDSFQVFEALLDVVEEDPRTRDDDEVLRRLVMRLNRNLVKANPQLEDRELPRMVADLQTIARYLERRLSRTSGLCGYMLQEVTVLTCEDFKCELLLAFLGTKGNDTFRVSIEHRVEGRNYLAFAEEYGLGYASDTPPDRPSRKRLLQSLARLLSVVSARRRRRTPTPTPDSDPTSK